jgi:anti-anti-sigma regulatory factor
MSRALTVTSDVRVDLHELHFADASLIVDLVMIASRLRKLGCRMILDGPQPQVWQLIEVVGMHRLPGVTVESRAPALG